jgi:hypothetical protein
LLSVLVPLSSGGCALVGYVAAVMPAAPVKARYAGLAGQKVAVLTWCDRASTYDYPMLPGDVTMLTQMKLAQAADPKTGRDEMKGTTFVEARQIVRWQKNHPELEMRSVAELAPRAATDLGCTRLVYIEVQPFSLHDPRTPLLLKGYAALTIRVAEVAGDGTAKVVYEEAGLEINFPPDASEGVPATDSMTSQYIYKGLLNRLTTEAAVRFFTISDDEKPR